MPSIPGKDSDNDAQRELLQRTLDQLPAPVRGALETLSFPHWFGGKLLERLVAREAVNTQLAATVTEESGFIERWTDGAFSVLAPARTILLEGAAADVQSYRKRSLLFAETFDELAHDGGDVFDHTESVYHLLAADPERGAELMLADGITWKSEPIFAFDALERLVSGAREQQQRGFLSERAGRYLELLALYLPRAGNTAFSEEKVLRGLLDDEGDVDLFRAELRLRLGLAVLSRGGTREARELFDSARMIFFSANLARGKADALRSLGRVALRIDRLKEARDMFAEARTIFVELGLDVSAAHCVKSLAETEFYRGRGNEAIPLFQSALVSFSAAAAYLGEANTRVVYAQLLSTRGEFAEAYKHVDLATGIYAAIGHHLGLANCLKNRGVVLFEEGHYGEALKVLADAFDSYERWGSESGRANCWLWSAACETRLGNPKTALLLLDKASAVFDRIGERFGKASVMRQQGLALVAADRPYDALMPLQQARDKFKDIGNDVETKAAAVALGQAAVAANFPAPFTRAYLYSLASEAAADFATIGFRRYQREAEALLGAATRKPSISPARNGASGAKLLTPVRTPGGLVRPTARLDGARFGAALFARGTMFGFRTASISSAMNGANGMNGAGGPTHIPGELLRPMGFSPWPSIERDSVKGGSRLVWRGQSGPRVQRLPAYDELVDAQQPGPFEMDLQELKRGGFTDEKVFDQVKEALKLRRRPTTPFTGWTSDNRSIAAISQFAAVGGWAGLEKELVYLIPQDEKLTKELDLLLELIAFRGDVLGEAVAQRNGMIAYFQGLTGFTDASHPRTAELCGLALTIGEFVAMHYKALFNRPRPSELCPTLMPPIEVPGHPAFPSIYATGSHLLARLLAAVLPEHHPAIPLLLPLAHRIAINREVLGLHYRSDSEAGEILAERIFSTILGSAGWMVDKAVPALYDGTRLIIPGRAKPPMAPTGMILGEVLSAAHTEWR